MSTQQWRVKKHNTQMAMEVSDGARVEVSDLCATSPCLPPIPIPRKSLPHVFSSLVGNHFKTVIEHACSLREFPRIWTV